MNSKGLKSLGFVVIVLLLSASPVFAGSGRFSVGALGGWAWHIADEAVGGFPETEFKNSPVYGGTVMYRFSNGFALELCIKHLEMDLEEAGENFGTLKMTPLILFAKYQGMPVKGKGLTGHGDIGVGINFTSFDKGPFVKNLEITYGVNYSIDTDDSFIFELGGGLDYFFTKRFSLYLDARLMLGVVGTSWKVVGPGGAIPLTEIDEFEPSNIHVLLGARFWF